jgi:hypothetical protein
VRCQGILWHNKGAWKFPVSYVIWGSEMHPICGGLEFAQINVASIREHFILDPPCGDRFSNRNPPVLSPICLTTSTKWLAVTAENVHLFNFFVVVACFTCYFGINKFHISVCKECRKTTIMIELIKLHTNMVSFLLSWVRQVIIEYF